MLLQLRRIYRVCFWCEYLYRHIDVVNIIFGKPRWMASNNAVHKVVALSSKAKDGPAAEAVSRCTNELVLGGQMLSACEDLWFTDLTRIPFQVLGNIDLLPARVVQKNVCWETVAAQAGIQVSMCFLELRGGLFRAYKSGT